MLFVATDTGMAGFDVNNTITSESYIAEKLKRNTNVTTERLTVLINNIKNCLYNMIIDPTAYEFDFKFSKPEVEEE